MTPPSPPSSGVPELPAKSYFSPGKSHSSFTPMGQRFLVWLGNDISKQGSTYTPGPKFSTYDEENVRKCQTLMGDTPDKPGTAYFGPKQWDRLFTSDPPKKPVEPPAPPPPGPPIPPGSNLTIVYEPISGFEGLRPFKSGGGKPKVILHTVEGPKPNWAALKKGIPHYTYDSDGMVYQHLHLDVAAYTLANIGDGPSPNSDAGVVIQIEMAGYAKDSATRPDAWYARLKELLEYICDAVDCPYEFPLTFVGDEAYGVDGVARIPWDNYTRLSGIIGHQHVPKNDHWDPGKLDVGKLR